MSATKEKRIEQPSVSHVKKLGIIAGGGVLPFRLVKACEEKGIEPFLVGLEGQTDPFLVQDKNHIWSRIGAAGSILKTLHDHDIKDLVLIGSIRRPSLLELRPDLKTAEFFARFGWKAIGDDDLLGVLRTMLEEEGFQLHGVHRFAQDLLAPAGPVGKYEPKKADWIDIRRGLLVSQKLGALDVGQSVVVQEGIVLAVEGAEGTDALIERCQFLKRKGRKGVLVKTCKPQQDQDLDLPTIGSDTLRAAIKSNLAGIVLEAQKSLIVDLEDVIQIANQHKMFVIGVHVEDEL